MKYFISVIFVMVSLCAYGEVSKLDYEEIPPDALESINSYSARTVAMMKQGGAAEFDYSEKSVKFLSGVIDDEGPTYSEKARNMLPTIWGAYLGDAIIKKHGGKWVKFANSYAVMVNQSGVLFPMSKVDKHISNGKEDSIYGLYLLAGENAENIAEALEKP
jgi:hypothetical protein